MVKSSHLCVTAFCVAAAAYFLPSSDSEEIMTTKIGSVSVSECIRGSVRDPNPYSFSLRFDLAVVSTSQSDYEEKATYMQTKGETIKALVSDTASDIRTVAKKGLESGYDISYLFKAEGVKEPILESIKDLKASFSEEVGTSYVIKMHVVDPKIGCP